MPRGRSAAPVGPCGKRGPQENAGARPLGADRDEKPLPARRGKGRGPACPRRPASSGPVAATASPGRDGGHTARSHLSCREETWAETTERKMTFKKKHDLTPRPVCQRGAQSCAACSLGARSGRAWGEGPLPCQVVASPCQEVPWLVGMGGSKPTADGALPVSDGPLPVPGGPLPCQEVPWLVGTEGSKPTADGALPMSGGPLAGGDGGFQADG